MVYEVKDPIWQFVDHWQTLIAGVLALLAALGTIAVTVCAARKQIKTTQDQIEVMVRLERRRIACESYAFFATLQAAMNGTLEDVQAASDILGGSTNPSYERHNNARQRVKKTAFADLRSAFVRLGGLHTGPFLRIETAIDDLNEHVIRIPASFTASLNVGLIEQLDRIKSLASFLRTEAENEMERCNKVLAETPTSPVA